MEDLYALDLAESRTCLDNVTDLEGAEEQDYQTAGKVLEIAAECHTDCHTGTGEQGGEAGGIDTKGTDNGDDEQDGQQDIDETHKEGVEGGIDLAVREHPIHEFVDQADDGFADKVYDDGDDDVLACLDAELDAFGYKLVDVLGGG